MNRPLVALNRVTNFFATGHLYAGEEELLAARHLQVEPGRLPVRAPELVPGDLHRNAARVHQAQTSPVSPYLPDAIQLMPGSLVAEHQEVGIRGRELKMIQPARIPVENIRLPRRNLERVELLGLLRFEHLLEPLRFGPAAVNRTAARLSERPRQPRLVCIDGRNRAAEGQLRDELGGLGVQVRGIELAPALIIHLPAARPDDNPARARLGQRRDLPRRPVEHHQPVAGSWRAVLKHHLVALGRKSVLVEIEALAAARNSREPDDSVAGVGVHPLVAKRCSPGSLLPLAAQAAAGNKVRQQQPKAGTRPMQQGRSAPQISGEIPIGGLGTYAS